MRGGALQREQRQPGDCLPFGAERRSFMLDFDRVALCFQQLSGCRADRLDEVMPIVMAAVRTVEEGLDESKVTEAALPACEYAAACVAVYDYVCREASREQMAVTAAGNADNSGDFTHRIRGAEELKKEAMRRIAWVRTEDGFLFETM